MKYEIRVTDILGRQTVFDGSELSEYQHAELVEQMKSWNFSDGMAIYGAVDGLPVFFNPAHVVSAAIVEADE